MVTRTPLVLLLLLHKTHPSSDRPISFAADDLRGRKTSKIPAHSPPDLPDLPDLSAPDSPRVSVATRAPRMVVGCSAA